MSELSYNIFGFVFEFLASQLYKKKIHSNCNNLITRFIKWLKNPAFFQLRAAQLQFLERALNESLPDLEHHQTQQRNLTASFVWGGETLAAIWVHICEMWRHGVGEGRVVFGVILLVKMTDFPIWSCEVKRWTGGEEIDLTRLL